MADCNIQDKTEELNKRIDDAFIELDTQRNRISGLTKECNELKREFLRLEKEQKSTLSWLCMITVMLLGLVMLQLVLLFI